MSEPIVTPLTSRIHLQMMIAKMDRATTRAALEQIAGQHPPFMLDADRATAREMYRQRLRELSSSDPSIPTHDGPDPRPESAGPVAVGGLARRIRSLAGRINTQGDENGRNENPGRAY